jgi:phosphatidylglycerol---prolipoprotein diacylglyceryl transferase
MHPVLLQLGPFGLYSYGAMIALGGAMATLFWWRRRSKMGLRSDDDFWLLINAIIVSGFVGGRLLFLFEYTSPWTAQFWRALVGFSSGFSVMGAFVSVLLGLWLVARRARAPFLPLLDYICAAAPLWHAFGRLGCFLAGCCFGRLTDAPWGVTFRDPRSMVDRPFLGHKLHPAQLYEGLGDLLIALVLIKMVLPRVERETLPRGAVVAVYFGCYGVLRFVMESFRGDTVPFGYGLTAAQAFSVGMITTAIGIFLYNRRKSSLCIQS